MIINAYFNTVSYGFTSRCDQNGNTKSKYPDEKTFIVLPCMYQIGILGMHYEMIHRDYKLYWGHDVVNVIL